jgi:hypothetical protein
MRQCEVWHPSVDSGSDTGRSDIDLLVVGSPD